MTNDEFLQIVDEQYNLCLSTLNDRRERYEVEGDRLGQFKMDFGEQNAIKSLGGMMRKHTTALYKMINEGEEEDLHAWEEIITDHINYLFLLKGLLTEWEFENEADE